MIAAHPVPVVPIHDPLLAATGVSLHVQREELVHPAVSGNKWYKLKYNLQQARADNHRTLLTFGGAYSNHIYATAAAGKAFGFHTTGIIRGEETQTLNHTLRFAQANGMQLHFVSRQAYRDKDDPGFVAKLQQQFGRFYLLPEGGTNLLAVKGCMELARHAAAFDCVCVCVGTGGTLAGIAAGMDGNGKLLGFPALKNGQFLTEEINRLTQDCCGKVYDNYALICNYHFGGYARFKPELIDFINHFAAIHCIPLEPVYTGKMFFALFDLIRQGFFPKGSRILAIHSGGLQGVQGYNERFGAAAPVYLP